MRRSVRPAPALVSTLNQKGGILSEVAERLLHHLRVYEDGEGQVKCQASAAVTLPLQEKMTYMEEVFLFKNFKK